MVQKKFSGIGSPVNEHEMWVHRPTTTAKSLGELSNSVMLRRQSGMARSRAAQLAAGFSPFPLKGLNARNPDVEDGPAGFFDQGVTKCFEIEKEAGRRLPKFLQNIILQFDAAVANTRDEATDVSFGHP